MPTRSELKLGIEDIRNRFFSDPMKVRAEEALCSLMDSALGRVWESQQNRAGYAVMAVGGYGRRVLHPKSDLDLLIFFTDRVVEDIVNDLLTPVWDLDFRVGHQIRESSDFRHFEPEQMESYTAFLDARFLFGEAAVADSFTGELLRGLLRRSQRRFLRALVDMKDVRHERYGGTVFQLEPDLKDAPGGLRDYHWTHWVTRVLELGDDDSSVEAVGFLHRLRNYLHFMSGRDQNELSYEYQERIAAELGYTDSDRGEAAEHLMHDYFLKAEEIARSVSKWEGEIVGGSHALSVEEQPRDQREIMAVFLEAHRRKMSIDAATVGRVREALAGFTEDDFAAQVYGRTVLDMMRDRRGIYRILRLMHQVGVLGRIFPEFEAIRCRVIRDFFHKYTVDEHSLIAIRNIEQLGAESGARNARRGLGAILDEMESPELLPLALLLHDIGKSAQHHEGDHVCSSVEGVDAVLERVGLSDAEQERVRAVIRNHLEMSKIIMRRDLTDPNVIAQFAELVGTPEDLRMLCLLTYADMKAVSPEVLTSWKEDLLWQLYVATYYHLLHGFADDRYVGEEDIEGEINGILRFVAFRVGVDDLRNFLDGVPRQYLRATPKDQIARHFEQYQKLSEEVEVVMHVARRDGFHEIMVMTPDRPYLFSRITGVLSAYGMNILRAQAFANRSGIVFDLITLEDVGERLTKNPREVDQLQQVMEDAVAGRVQVDALLRRMTTSVVFRRKKGAVPTGFHFDDESSERCTILEISARDDIGLLFHISRVLSDHGCNIEVALITTEGNRAIDVFYLTRDEDRLPRKLQETLERDLLAAIEPLSPSARPTPEPKTR